MDNTELAARIDAVSKFVLQLAAELEMTGLIDGPRFSQRLRGPERMADQLESVQLTRERLADMLDTLDNARALRQERGPRP